MRLRYDVVLREESDFQLARWPNRKRDRNNTNGAEGSIKLTDVFYVGVSEFSGKNRSLVKPEASKASFERSKPL